MMNAFEHWLHYELSHRVNTPYPYGYDGWSARIFQERALEYLASIDGWRKEPVYLLVAWYKRTDGSRSQMIWELSDYVDMHAADNLVSISDAHNWTGMYLQNNITRQIPWHRSRYN